ncbi:uncharacterized protein PHACADRAFT_179143 [Phanerochaete carnosa HHB-10118-sp]|uniref:Fe2OG dioxygenase domain-containing protein n=1 Tax=Phanerochaete carnosa (strain HHB-10118-sp) TaxID=650164 RepID=K5VT56_PHACS|nr:uncharacterized protein PHACADRAFT_179143 [Phanerochaete carnosa HHB-10118-sp]EKM49759.1 hypothetical protein PHACADRAFT_179143 [Phanerochaete carnosa HHB-10118-sp]
MEPGRGAPLESGPSLLFKRHTNNAFQEIPVIDLHNIRSDDLSVRRALADEVRNASMNVGFFYIKNHGIPQETISAALEAAKGFFALSQASKETISIDKSTNFKGYTPLLGENSDPENRGDLHEGFDLGWEDPSGNVRADDGPMSGVNLWPDERELPGFKEAVMRYYYAVVALGKLLFPVFALALNLPEDFFADKITKPAAIMRLLYYPSQDGTVDDRVQGIGAHTDYECFTILWQDHVPALQVLNKDKKWVDATPIPGTFVVNLGDQLARWTNDVFTSTVHRAINRSGIERYSIPLFFGTDYNVLLEALPSCVSTDHPPKYEPIIAGDFVRSRIAATYKHSK